MLFIVLPTAIVLKVLLDARAAPPPSLRRFLPRAVVRYGVTFALLVGGVLAYAGYKAARGGSVHDLFGQYSGDRDGRATCSSLWRAGSPSTSPSSSTRSA